MMNQEYSGRWAKPMPFSPMRERHGDARVRANRLGQVCRHCLTGLSPAAAPRPAHMEWQAHLPGQAKRVP